MDSVELRLVALMVRMPAAKSPSVMHLMKPGMLMPTGQPSTQPGFLQPKQRAASSAAISAPYPRATSSKLRTRSKGSCLGIGLFT